MAAAGWLTPVSVSVKQELEKQYSPSRWSHRMAADDVIKAHVKALKEGTEQARSLAQTLINVPYGDGDGEKLDVYIPRTDSLGDMDLMVSQVRRSVVSVIQQYSHIREVAVRNSPSQLVPQLKQSSSGCQIVVAVAQNDSPEFRKQSEEYYKVSSHS
ncbi:hypothetical protein GOODEAATRI_017636 [Goodea atripinnis]|uniref:Uncharacterized protein n=1 Tax=Goodea atripinnis TaxID=208336 RepID=A0ABV0MIN6_9TELE